ncbi:MAG: LysR family transcriptional regulator [Clostridiales Family XIII bacterium]|jgi:DNA-binding transcriptional LysR family regulator|nr:LysR family transcriptional regulator [Clostridiales Family XIII bacterium]
MLDETKIKCFLSLAKTLNFTNTSKVLYMTQQAVSKNISAFENYLGFPLFVRSPRAVRLTAEGEILFEKLSRMSDEFLSTVQTLKRRESRDVQLHAGYQRNLDFGPVLHEAQKKLKERVPGIVLEGNRYCPSVLNRMMHDGQLEMILINRRFLLRGDLYNAAPMTSMPQYLMLSPDYPGVSENATYEAFLGEPFIIDSFESESPAEFNDRLDREIKLWGLSPSGILVVPDRDSAYTYAELGRGVVIGSTNSRMAMGGRALMQYPIDKSEVLLAVWRKEDANPLIEMYVDLLRSGFGRAGAGRGTERPPSAGGGFGAIDRSLSPDFEEKDRTWNAIESKT